MPGVISIKSLLTALATGLCMIIGIFLFSHLGYALDDTTSKDRIKLIAAASVLYSIPKTYPETIVVQDGSTAKPGILQVPYGKIDEYSKKLIKVQGVHGLLPVQGPPAFSLSHYGGALRDSLKDYAKGDMGSLYMRYKGEFPLTDNLGMMFSRTSNYLLFGLAFAIITGTFSAMIASTSRMIGRVFDGIHSLLVALPDFLLVVLLQMLCIFLANLLDRPVYLIIEFSSEVPFFIPFATIALVPGALIYGTLRVAIHREWAEDYVITARAKGISRTQIMFRHVLRNILEDLFAVLPKAISLAVGGAVVAEVLCQIFGLGGIIRNPIYSIGSFTSLSSICLVLGFIMFGLHLFFAILKKLLRVESKREEAAL
ncbi:MAG: ABC transporter permease subunit [Gorillibacterium sp.]|nr:ABC transporter permease subunit [Gorillibacterium sp.]